MKIKEVKQLINEYDQVHKEGFNQIDSDPDNAKKLLDQASKIKESIPREFKIDDTIKNLNRVKGIVAASDPILVEMLEAVSQAFKKKSAPGLNHFDDDVDAQTAIDRANKMKSFI